MFIRHRLLIRYCAKNVHATAKALLCIHHDQRSKVCVLYTGTTGDLRRRVWQHKSKLVTGFTSRYNLTRLVYYEVFIYPDATINREKEIKGWRRSKKIALIESMNPRWDDLGSDWQDMYKPIPAATRMEVPRPAGENAGLRDDAAEVSSDSLKEDADKVASSG